MELISHSLTPTLIHYDIRSLIDLSTTRAAINHSVLYLHMIYVRLALKLFRGEPAITKLDWNFSPSHKSSAGVSTNVGSVLQWVLPHLQPAHG